MSDVTEGTAALVLGASGGLAQAIICELMADAEIDTVIAVSRNAVPEHFSNGPVTPLWIETEYSEPAMAAVVEQLQSFAGRITIPQRASMQESVLGWRTGWANITELVGGSVFSNRPAVRLCQHFDSLWDDSLGGICSRPAELTTNEPPFQGNPEYPSILLGEMVCHRAHHWRHGGPSCDCLSISDRFDSTRVLSVASRLPAYRGVGRACLLHTCIA